MTAHPAPDLRPAPTPTPLASVQGTLALDLAQHDPPVAQPGGRGGDVVVVDELTRRRLELWSRRLAQAVVEIVSGDRPVTQLLRWTTGEVYADLARRAVLVARASGRTPGLGGTDGPVVRPQVVGVRTSMVATHAAELCVHVRHGARSRAVAARLEVRHGRWQCVALEFA